ncbi:MAG TPA: peptidoglycan-binding protein [Candidatus Paceibacterota bacterium]
MRLRIAAASAAMAIIFASFGVASADALSVSCSGAVDGSDVTWTAASSGGVAPVAFLWGNGSTSTSQTVVYSVGTHSITIQGTDASSTVATNSCSATVAPASTLPVIASFTATPSTIIKGQSAVLAWNVTNASSTSINHGVGTVSSTSVTVSPTKTTTYELTAVNPNGDKQSSVKVTVNATSTGTTTPPGFGGSIQEKIAALIKQIAALQAQLAQLITARFGGTVDNPGFIPPGQIGKAACIILNRDLHEGSRGDDVRKLQELLRADSDVEYNASTTGVFGPVTLEAMKKFQEKHGIIATGTGYVGPLTRGFFSRSCGKGLLDNEHKKSDSSSATSSDDDDDSDDEDDEEDEDDEGDDDDDSSNGNNGRGRGNNPNY